MTRLEAALQNLCQTLASCKQEFALVGGLAVSARAEPRFTRDLDLALVAADDSAAEGIVHQLIQAGYQVLATVEQDATHRLATVRLLPPGETSDGIVADLLFASSGIEPELVRSAEPIALLPGFVIPVATVAYLLALKVLSLTDERPQDLLDIRSLRGVATNVDIERAREALRLIDQRGFGRGKQLFQEFEQWVLRAREQG
jgi:hypothetical protein